MSTATGWTRGHRSLKAFLLLLASLGVLLVGASVVHAVGTSTFDSRNGSPGPATSAGTNEDWTSLSLGGQPTALGTALHFVGHQDVPSGSADNAFGNGAKEDIACPSVVSGSIPPNKSDLTRFYTAWEGASNGHYYLYLAWERTNNLGNANMDFEFNQNSAACTNGVTPNRTAGDLLVTYDFGGSGAPDIGLLTWASSSHVPAVPGFAANACFSSSSFPCWSDRADLSAAGDADGAVNAKGTVTDPIAFTDPISHLPVPAPGAVVQNGFGEAGIDLTAANVLAPGTCEHFGSAELNSRSSTSFTSELKDFISPVGVNITNCGDVHIVKTDDGNNSLGGVTFHLWSVSNTDTSNGHNTGTTGDTEYNGTGGSANYTCTTATVATATTTDPVGSCDIGGLAFGTYWVVEDSPPAGFNAAPDQKLTVDVTHTATTFTFVDTREPATLIFHKQDDAGAPMGGVTFHLWSVSATDTTGPTAGDTEYNGAGGTANYSCTTLSVLSGALNKGDCEMANILPALAGTSYWIVEDSPPPTGYNAAAPYKVTLTLDQTLDLRGTAAGSHNFVDQRLFKIITLVCQEGATPSLYGAAVAYGAAGSNTVPTPGAVNTATSLTSTEVADLCALSSGADADLTPGTYPSATKIQ